MARLIRLDGGDDDVFPNNLGLDALRGLNGDADRGNDFARDFTLPEDNSARTTGGGLDQIGQFVMDYYQNNPDLGRDPFSTALLRMMQSGLDTGLGNDQRRADTSANTSANGSASESDTAVSDGIDPNIQRVVITGKRFTPQEKEAYDQQMKRASMPDLRPAPAAKNSAKGKMAAPAISREMIQNWDKIKGQLVDAALKVGVDPGSVAEFAAFESKFKPTARPISTSKPESNKVRQFDDVMAMSTAYGVGQFTDGGWLQALRDYGAKYGIPNAAKLSMREANQYRNDLGLQINLLAEATKANIKKGHTLGGNNDVANAYALHNLGPTGGTKFLQALAQNPNSPVKKGLRPSVIKGNESLYGKNVVTLQDAYDKMVAAMASGDRFAEEARKLARSR